MERVAGVILEAVCATVPVAPCFSSALLDIVQKTPIDFTLNEDQENGNTERKREKAEIVRERD